MLAFEARPPWEAYAGRLVVYLSPDADEVVPAALDEGTAYCVGGLVDRMVLKGSSVNHVRQGAGEGAGV